jgi:hypothetical protein
METHIMATQTRIVVTPQSTNLLTKALLVDGGISGTCGVITLLEASQLDGWLGIEIPLLIGLGIMMVVWGISLFYASSQLQSHLREIGMLVMALNMVWVVGSVVVLAGQLIDLTTVGTWTVIVVGDIVFAFAVAQLVGLRRLSKSA